jgi:hypothetical protein
MLIARSIDRSRNTDLDVNSHLAGGSRKHGDGTPYYQLPAHFLPEEYCYIATYYLSLLNSCSPWKIRCLKSANPENQ